ncbi:MAG: putative 4-hydroxybenzoate polyprenyltransferase [Chloroflexi bacterium]|nr:putative 4-hydroxybenzoate polyprenyltransferase [Chloroflexota bacterium]
MSRAQAEHATASMAAPGPVRRFRLFLETIKFEHSVFALPFAVAAAFTVSGGWPDWGSFGWVVLAMVSMRTFGMAANRLIDAEIDARNPRTASRPTATGVVSRLQLIGYMLVFGVIFIATTSQLDRMAWPLAPVPLAVMIVYPYLKRLTWLAHLGMGSVYLIVPPAVAIAMTGTLPAWSIVMGFAGMFWVAGFDVLYATADREVDRAQGLHSIPQRFGIPAAINTARLFHLTAAALLITAGAIAGAGALYYVGAGAAAVLLAYENSLVSANNLSRLNMAFFTMNGIIALVFGLFAAADSVVFS